MTRTLWLCSLLCACGGLTENRFRNEQARLTCERKEECPDAATGADCSSVTTPPGGSELYDCTFVEAQAQACLDAIPDAECQGSTVEYPAPCSQVFVDCVRI